MSRLVARLAVPKLVHPNKQPLPTPNHAQSLRLHLRCWLDNSGPQYVDNLVEVMELESSFTKEDIISVLQFYIRRGSLFRLWPHFSKAIDQGIDFLSDSQVFRDAISLLARHGYVDHVLDALARSRGQLNDLVMAWVIVELVKFLPRETEVLMPTPGALKTLLAAAAGRAGATAVKEGELNQFRSTPKPLSPDKSTTWTPDQLLILVLRLRKWFPENLDRSDLDNAVLFAMSRFGRLDLMMEYLLIMTPNSDSYYLLIQFLGNLGLSGHALQKTIFEKLDGRTSRKLRTMSLYSLMFQAAVATNDFSSARKMQKGLQNTLAEHHNKWRRTFLEEDFFQTLRAKEVLLPPSRKLISQTHARSTGFEFQLRLLLDHSRQYSMDYSEGPIPSSFARPAVSFAFLDGCLDIFLLMQANNAQMPPTTFALLIEACMLHDCVDMARELWRFMKLSHVKPSAEVCIPMVTGLLRYGHVHDAVQLVYTMRSERITFTINFRRAFLRTVFHTQRHYVLRDHSSIWTELYFPGVRQLGPGNRADKVAGIVRSALKIPTHDRPLLRRELTRFLHITDKLRNDVASGLLPISNFIAQPILLKADA